MGALYYDLHDLDAALEQFDLVLDISEETGMDVLRASTLRNIAQIRRDLGDYEQSLAVYEKAFAALTGGDRTGTGDWHAGIAETLRKMGRLDEAFGHFQHALVIHRDRGTGHGNLMEVLDMLANALAEAGRPGEARRYLEEAADMAEATGTPRAAEFRDKLAALR